MKNIFNLLSNKFKKQFYLLMVLMLFASILEMLGISLIIPVIISLLDKNIFNKYPILEDFNILLNYPTNQELIFISILLFGVIYILKNLYFLFFYTVESRLLASIFENISQNLYSTYINQPYNYYLKINTSEIINRFRSDLPAVRSSLIALSTIFTEIFIILGILSFLIIYNPKVLISVFILVSFFSYLFFFFFKNKFKTLGNERQITENTRSKIFQETFAAIKEIKVSKLENIFKINYERISEKLKNNTADYTFLNHLPRIFFETLAVLILVLIVTITIIFTSEDITNSITTLGVFAGASFKFLPSANRLIGSFNKIKYMDKSIIKLNEDLDLDENSSIENIKKFYSEELVSVDYYYGEKKIFHNLNFKVNSKDKIFIYGETGSGKSTLIDILLGLKKINHGKIFVNGKDFSGHNFSFNKILGYVPQKVFLFDESIKNNITLFQNLSNEELLIKSIKHSKLIKFIDSLKEGYNSYVGQDGIRISGGQKQRIGIAREIFKNPDFIIFDESTSSLDLETERDFLNDFLKTNEDKTIIFISHNQNLKKHFKKIYKLEKGKLNEEKKI